MEDPPPPYPGLPAQLQSEQPSSRPRPDPDLAVCTHSHLLLISVTKSIDGGATVFHHWTARSPTSSSMSLHTHLDVNSLRQVRSFRELGTFTLPIEMASANIHRYLTSLITKSSTNSSDPEIIPHIVAQLSSLPQNEGLSVQFFSIPVLSDSPEALLTGGSIPIWKWAKPTSPYSRKTGLWEVEMGKAIEDGEWAAGKELLILVTGVSEGKAEDVKNRRFISVG